MRLSPTSAASKSKKNTKTKTPKLKGAPHPPGQALGLDNMWRLRN